MTSIDTNQNSFRHSIKVLSESNVKVVGLDLPLRGSSMASVLPFLRWPSRRHRLRTAISAADIGIITCSSIKLGFGICDVSRCGVLIIDVIVVFGVVVSLAATSRGAELAQLIDESIPGTDNKKAHQLWGMGERNATQLDVTRRR